MALGTVTNIKEAHAWLGYTYLFIRMKSNPLVYGIAWDEVLYDLFICFFLIKLKLLVNNNDGQCPILQNGERKNR